MNTPKLEDAIEEALMAHRSAIWWQEEMNAALAELQKIELEEDDPRCWTDANLAHEEKRETLERKIECLLVKGRWEDANLEKVMKGVELFNLDEKRHIVTEITKRWAEEKSQNGSHIP